MLSETDPDKKYFIFLLMAIISIGILMVYSSSYFISKDLYGNPYQILFKQLIFLIIGVGALVALSHVSFEFLVRLGTITNFVFIILLLLTILGPLGISIKGSHRWIDLGFTKFQPGEFVKFTLILAAITYFENFQTMRVKRKILNGLFILSPLIIFLIQPDFGSFSICLIIITFIAFLSHFPRKLFYSMLTLGFGFAISIVFIAPYRVKRLLTFLDPWKDPKDSGFQIIQSFLAFANGSFWGKGIGNSTEKLFYLPEAHNDFILSVLGEELGFVGVFVCVLLYLVFIYFGFKLISKNQNRFAVIAGSTVIFAIGLQTVLNMGVVLGLLPTKGLNLPFISSGGSSLVANLMAIGMFFSALKAKTSFEQNGNIENEIESDNQNFIVQRPSPVYQQYPLPFKRPKLPQ
jgi:cell division protein FtsW